MNLSSLDDIGDILFRATKDAEKKTKLRNVFQTKKLDSTLTSSTGLLLLDYLMGGGIPSGKIIGISSDEHMGKSALAAEMTWEQLQDGRYSTYMDGEGTQDPIFLKKRGIDFQKYRGKRNKNDDLIAGQRDKVWFYQPHTGGQFKTYIHTVCSALPEVRELQKPPLVFLLDSALSIVSDAIAEDIDGNNTAMHAIMYSNILPHINSSLLRSGSSLVYTNQLREDVGAGFKGMGDTKYEPGGKALGFYASCRIRLAKSKAKLEDGVKEHPFHDDFIPDLTPRAGGVWEEGHDGPKSGLDRSIICSFKTIKNKFYTPFKVGYYRIFFEENGETGSGFCPVFDVYTTLLYMGLIKKGKNKSIYVLADLPEEVKEIANFIPAEFDYYTLKSHIRSQDRRELRMNLRRILLDSGWAYQGHAVDVSPEEEFDLVTGEIIMTDDVKRANAASKQAFLDSKVKMPTKAPKAPNNNGFGGFKSVDIEE